MDVPDAILFRRGRGIHRALEPGRMDVDFEGQVFGLEGLGGAAVESALGGGSAGADEEGWGA